MNRTTALLLAMAALLAHALAVHMEPGGRLGQPFEESHAAFRLARNYVHEGSLSWNPQTEEGGLAAHDSPLLVAVSVVAERIYQPVNRFVQFAGVLAALLTIAVSVRFAVDRSAGIIPAILLVMSGAFAASASSGTEYPFIAFLVTLAFVSWERRRPLAFALGLGLLVTTNVLGMIMALALGLRVLIARKQLPLLCLLPAFGLAAFLAWMPDGNGGHLYWDRLQAFVPNGERTSQGLAYLLDFLWTSITPFLLIFPAIAILTGSAKHETRGALGLAMLWLVLVVLDGGGPRAFTIALVPALPLMAIAIQFGVIAALDSRRRWTEPLSWAALLVCALVSGFPSKASSRLGWHMAWIEEAHADPGVGRTGARGRSSLQQEQQLTTDLRALGRFLRERVEPELTLLTPWSGVLGYLADRKVMDFTGERVGAAPEIPGTFDLLAALEKKPDLILPQATRGRQLEGQRAPAFPIDSTWLERDAIEQDSERLAALSQAFSGYELVTVPVADERDPRPIAGRPVRLLRRRDLALAPRLDVRMEEGELVIEALAPEGGGGHPQLVDLQVVIEDGKDEWWLDPTGRWNEENQILARVGLVVGVGSELKVRLMRVPLDRGPSGLQARSVRARLVNPRMRAGHPLTPASKVVSIKIGD